MENLIDRNSINIIDLAIISEIQSWAYYNCTKKAEKELIDKIRNKLNQLCKEDDSN